MNELSSYITDFMKIFTDPIKIDIINLLREEKKSANEIKEKTGISQAYCSQELQQLIKADLITYEKTDNIKYYQLTNKKIFNILSAITSYVLELRDMKTDKMKHLDNINRLS